MLFNSFSFILLHAVFLVLYWVSPFQKLRLVWLLAGSLLFYSWLYWPGLILLLLAIAMNYLFSRWIGSGIESNDNIKPKQVLTIAVICNLLLLGWFKYSSFVVVNLLNVINLFGLKISAPDMPTWLPLGISFYTFQVIGYLVDIYRRKVPVEKSLLVFAVPLQT